MANEIITNTVSVTFSWVEATGTTKNHCRISRYYDFSVVPHEDNTLTTGNYQVDLTSGNYKYYWQHRPYVGGTWQKWNEVQSFEKGTVGSLTVTDGKWLMFESSEMSDYTLQFTSAPNYSYTEEQIYRTGERNLVGDILSEFQTTKGSIRLEFKKNNTVSRTEKDQIMRYYGLNSGAMYLGCAPYNGADYYRKLWKIWFSKEPSVTPLDGNEERFMMVIDLEEI